MATTLQTTWEAISLPHCLALKAKSIDIHKCQAQKWSRLSTLNAKEMKADLLPQKSSKVREEADSMVQPKNRAMMSLARLAVHPAITGWPEATHNSHKGHITMNHLQILLLSATGGSFVFSPEDIYQSKCRGRLTCFSVADQKVTFPEVIRIWLDLGWSLRQKQAGVVFSSPYSMRRFLATWKFAWTFKHSTLVRTYRFPVRAGICWLADLMDIFQKGVTFLESIIFSQIQSLT